MIYIIDDKKSRQRDYGWDEDRLSKYSDIVKPIWGVEAFNNFQNQIINEGNIILFHESFPQSKDFNDTLDKNSTSLYVAKFSGSKGARFVDKRRCMLPPDVLYGNLEIFINNYQKGDLDFKYLAFGERYEIEEQLRNRLIDVNTQNTGTPRVLNNKKIFFAATSDELEVEPPFDVTPTKDWDLDFIDRDITDIDLDGLVSKWFLQEKYDAIYIPLCFGGVLSDFMGLRLAMHIRLTSSPNQQTPIWIYGVATLEELMQNDCFDILKTQTVRLISCDNASFISSVSSEMPICNLQKEIKLIHLDLPSNIGGHSLANQWGATILAQVAGVDYEPTEQILNIQKSLYFKYIKAKNGSYGPDNSENKIEETKGKRILLIDDEADKGWSGVFKKMFDGGYLDVINVKLSGFNEIPEKIKQNIYIDLYDLYLVDLRLLGENEEHIVSTIQFSGRDVINEIKRNNEGNQVVVITASNKAWNLRNLFAEGANGYYVKESPELLLPPELSKENYDSLIDSINSAFKNCYKRRLWAKQYNLIEYIKKLDLEQDLQDKLIKQLEVFETFMLKAENENELAATYLTLFQILEIIKHHYSPRLGKEFKSLPDYVYAILKDFGHLRSHQKINNLNEVNNGRNNMVHKLKNRNATDYKTKDGLTTLFEVVNYIIRLL